MPATSPPVARSVAAATLPLVIAAAATWAAPSSALAARWLRPVPGEVARPFDYARGTPFAAGAHRGVDLAARPGAAARAVCGGPVLHAGPVAGGAGVVSVRCAGPVGARAADGGAWRVSYLPLSRVAVAAGDVVRAGAPVGSVAAGHAGLHLGVRREDDPFGYVDPLPLLAPLPTPLRPPARPAPRGSPSRPAPRPHAAPVPPPRGAPLPRPHAALLPASRPGRGLAPWPVWTGLALVFCGAAGSGTLAVRRRRRDARRRATASAVYGRL